MKLLDQPFFLLKCLNPIKSKLAYFFQEFKNHENTLHLWRVRIFLTIFSGTILIGSLSYVANMKISFQSRDWTSALIWTIAYSILFTITFVRIIPFKIRVWIGLSVFYAIGISSFLTYGPIGSGRIWLLSFAILSSLLLGLRAGLIAVFINICTIFLLAMFLNTDFLTETPLTYSPLEYWLATGLSFVFMSTIISVSIGVLVRALEKNIQKEQLLTRDLKLSNEQLERENAERRLAEESLRRSQIKYKTLTNNLNVGIYRNTIGSDGRFLEANPAIVKMFGFESKNEFLKIKVSDLYRDSVERKKFNEKMLQKGFVRNEELLLRKNDGTPIICSVSAIKNKNDKVIFYDGVIEDVTERKRLESKFQQAQKMKAIGTLAGGVAHDLNNILSGIINYPELILMDLPKDSPFVENIKKIKESGQKAAAIVQDLLTLARRGVSTAEIVNLNNIISEYLISPEFHKLNSFHPLVKIETRLDSKLLNMMGSPVHLSKMLMNLVSNAAEAMLEGGKIGISTENKYIDRAIINQDNVEKGDYVLLTVSDMGTGMEAEEIGEIFEPFYTKKIMGRSGTGLGMTVVWGTVKDHKGYIQVESELKKGTTFKLYFPITRKQKTVDQKSRDFSNFMGNGERILVVDDVEEQREIASKILSQLGYTVKSVSSGEEAIKLLSKETADLIILDMIMPFGIDGLETYERIITIHPNQKAIIASGFSETDRVQEAQKLGAGAYLRKPYTIEKIALAVESELKKEKKAA
jgi:two-component system cell cycle sensor histidine kinase/response regulator CckA